MAIFKFYQIYRSIKEELGEDMALKLFPEYPTLPEKMPAHEQVQLGTTVINRMDELLDKDTISRIRQKHCCSIPKEDIEEIKRLKGQFNNLDDIIDAYSHFLSPGFVKRNGDLLSVSFGWGKCVCGMFRKLEAYEPISKTWCECCNGNVIKIYSMICGKTVSSRIIETVVSGDKDCIFEINI